MHQINKLNNLEKLFYLKTRNMLKNLVKTTFSTNYFKRNSHSLNFSKMEFRQLMDYETKTYTYILSDKKSRDAVIIDPVIEKVDRDLKVIKELDLNLKYALK